MGAAGVALNEGQEEHTKHKHDQITTAAAAAGGRKRDSSGKLRAHS